MRLYQLALDQSIVDCGMSYVFTLDDGGFFIIDGGYFTPGEAEHLYAFLKQQSKDSRIHINGWFFSHAHQDHIGCFINFIRRYADRIQLDALYYNFQPCDFSKAEGEGLEQNDEATFKDFYDACAEKIPDVPNVILHTGDRVALPGLEFSVLYTWPDMLPAESSFNDHSTVIMAEAAGTKILFLGDVYKEGSRCLLSSPQGLVCDLVQVAHHGYRGADAEVYKATRAKGALWPAPAESVEPNAHREANAWILNESGMEILLSGPNDTCIDLPYIPGNASVAPRNAHAL